LTRALRSARLGCRSTASVALLLLAGCGQFEVQGAVDLCPAQRRLTITDVRECWRDQATILTGQRSPEDRTAQGSLRGEPLPIAGRPLRHVIALDYSGSMYGGYEKGTPSTDSRCGWSPKPGGSGRKINAYFWQDPGFAALLRDGPLAGPNPGDPLHAMVFNSDVHLVEAGRALRFDAAAGRFAGGAEPLVDREAVLRSLTASPPGSLPANPFTSGLGDPNESRLSQLLAAAAALFESYPDERQGILWIVTDNIIEEAPHGVRGSSLERDVQNNRDFYARLHGDPRWQVVYAWPVHQASWLCGSTLMVYGLYYSSRERIDERGYADLCLGEAARLGGSEQVEAFARYASAQSPSPGGAFKLKPADLDVVRLAFEGKVDCPLKRVGEGRRCVARIQVQNLLHHRQVDAARITFQSSRADPVGRSGIQTLAPVRTAVPFCAGEIRVSRPLDIPEPIPPRGSKTLPVELMVPAVQTRRQSLADLWENAKFRRFQMVGSMSVGIRDLRTSMVIQPADLSGIYGVDALPEIFRNPETDNLKTSICLVMSVDNPNYLASVVLLTLALLLLAGSLVGTWFLRPKYHTVEVEGENRGFLRLTRLGWSPVLVDGGEVAKARLDLGGMPRLKGTNGHKVTRRGNLWEHQTEDGFGSPQRIALVPGRRSKRGGGRGDDF
jgi:hypothetical protein